MEILILFGILTGTAILLLFVGIGQAGEIGGSRRLEDYMGDQVVRSRPTSGRAGRLSQSANELVQGFDKILRSVAMLDNMAYTLQRAGLRLTVTEYLGLWLSCIGAAVVFSYWISRNGLVALIAAVGAGVMPPLYVSFRVGNRLHMFNDQLGNVLMQLSGSMRAGYGLLQAVDFVSSQMPAPAGPEFGQVVRDVKLGMSLIEALDSLTDRVGSDDLMLIVTAIRIHHETGGNLAEILETVSTTIRERVRIKGELRTLTAQQRYSGYVLAALPILIFFVLMLLNPEYESRLFTPGPTLCIPISALIMMVVGFLVIRRIISIEI